MAVGRRFALAVENRTLNFFRSITSTEAGASIERIALEGKAAEKPTLTKALHQIIDGVCEA